MAGGDTVLAVGVLTISLISSAIRGPLLAGLLSHSSGHGSALGLLGRFALVVIAPLVAGLLLRGLRPGLQRAAETLNGVAAFVVCALLYAAISGIHDGHELIGGLLGSAAFIGASTGVGLLVRLAWSGLGWMLLRSCLRPHCEISPSPPHWPWRRSERVRRASPASTAR